ncbi:MAG: ATP-binding cassette domain-containing protein [Isosphaeraceae bacterium]
MPGADHNGLSVSPVALGHGSPQRRVWATTRQPAARRSAIEVMDRLGLSGLATQQAARLSGGQQQLVALARALVLRPATLVLDEPTAHLDPATVALVESVIDEENRSRGMTVIWATHNLFQARRVAHRTGLMLQGELVELGPTATLFDSPTSSLTRAFVNGEMIY